MLFMNGVQEMEDPCTLIDLHMVCLVVRFLILAGVKTEDPYAHLLHAFTPVSTPESLRFCQVWP